MLMTKYMSVLIKKIRSQRGIAWAQAWHNKGGCVAYKGRRHGITGAVAWHNMGAPWHIRGVNRGIAGGGLRGIAWALCSKQLS